MDVPAPPAAAKAVVDACAALIAALPAQLDTGVRRRPVRGDTTRTAAWGDPVVTLRCGVPPPDPNATPLVLDGMPFVTVTAPGRVLWTTADRTVDVLLDIPTSYEQGYLVQALVPALRRLPAAARKPAG